MKIGLSVYPDEPGVIVEDSCYRLPSSMDLGDIPKTPEIRHPLVESEQPRKESNSLNMVATIHIAIAIQSQQGII
jgi:hypothetical protein